MVDFRTLVAQRLADEGLADLVAAEECERDRVAEHESRDACFQRTQLAAAREKAPAPLTHVCRGTAVAAEAVLD